MVNERYTVEVYQSEVGWYPVLVDKEGAIVYFDESSAHHKLREVEQTFTDLKEPVPSLRVAERKGTN